MVERSPYLTAFSHLIMVLGVIIVGFPLYLAFAASTHTAQDIVQVPMPMVPGSNFWQTYHDALFGGGSGPGSSAPVARMMWVSFITAIVITLGKDTFKASKGDAFYFTSDKKHWIENRSKTKAQILWISAPPSF